MSYDRGTMKNEVKEDLRQTKPKAIWVTLVYLVVTYVLTGVVSRLQLAWIPSGLTQQLTDISQMGWMMSEQQLAQLVSDMLPGLWQAAQVGSLFGLINAVISWTLVFGYQGYCLSAVRGESPGFRRLLCFAPQWGWVLLTGLLTALFTALWTILFCLLATVVTVVAIIFLPLTWAVTLTIVAWIAVGAGIIAISLRYSMANYILLDEKVDSLEAVSASKAMMRGRKWHLFVLQLSFFGWYLLVGVISGFLTTICGVVMGGVGAAQSTDSGFWMATGAAAGTGIGVVLSLIITLPLTMWLTGYVTGSIAKFYDLMKRVDQEAGLWGTGRESDHSSQPQSQAPDIPRYEEPVDTTPVPLDPPTPHHLPEPPASPKGDAPDRPKYE